MDKCPAFCPALCPDLKDNICKGIYNLTVAEAHTFFGGDGQWLVHNICPVDVDIESMLGDLPEEELNNVVGRAKNVINPNNRRQPVLYPSIEQFEPKVYAAHAEELDDLIHQRMHPLFPEQVESVGSLSNDELVKFRLNESISATVTSSGGLSLTGGHHRTAEIINRVRVGSLEPDTWVWILTHHE